MSPSKTAETGSSPYISDVQLICISPTVTKNLNVSFDVAMDILGFTKNEKIILKEYLKNKEYLLTL